MRKRRPDTIMSSEAEEEPVSVLQRFEKRLEGLVEGAFAKVFKGVVHPVEILNAMQREAEAHKAILAGGRTLVPNRYVIDLSPYDHSRLAPYAAALAQELAQSQAEFIGEQAWTVYGDVIVEIERGDGPGHGHVPGDGRGLHRWRGRPGAAARLRRRPAVLARTTSSGGGYQQHGARTAAVSGLVSGDGRTYPLQMGSTVIGRGDQANLRLPDVGISRRHARLDYDGNQVVLTDLGSTNGTMVNGQRVSAVALNPGDMIQLGHHHADLPSGRLGTLPEFVLTVARFGFLILLWIFVFTVVGVIRRDLFAGVRSKSIVASPAGGGWRGDARAGRRRRSAVRRPGNWS